MGQKKSSITAAFESAGENPTTATMTRRNLMALRRKTIVASKSILVFALLSERTFLIRILEYLQGADVIKLGTTSKKMYSCIEEDEIIWKYLLQRHYGFQGDNPILKHLSVKKLYFAMAQGSFFSVNAETLLSEHTKHAHQHQLELQQQYVCNNVVIF